MRFNCVYLIISPLTQVVNYEHLICSFKTFERVPLVWPPLYYYSKKEGRIIVFE